MIFPLPALITSSGMIMAPDGVVPASAGGEITGTVGGAELPTTLDPLAEEVTPADAAGNAVTEPLPPADTADTADAAPAPPDPDELLRPATADASEPPPPPHALTLRIAPLTANTNSTLLSFIIIYMCGNDENPPLKTAEPGVFNKTSFPRILDTCMQRQLPNAFISSSNSSY
jgi:hypothetical protein